MNKKKRFKARWIEWRKALNGDIPQSIYNQIAYMLLDYLTWKTINEGRRLIFEEAGEDDILNGMIHDFIDRHYVDSQSMQIRKLVDGAPLIGDKSVYSLLSVLKHMKDHAHLITRENICYAEGIPLTTDEIRKKKELFSQQMYKTGENPYWVPRKLWEEPIEWRHKSIDSLCGVTPENRSPTDKLCPGVLKKIETDLKDGVKKVKGYVDKHVAHAATPKSITGAKMPLSPDLTFADIKSARDAICRGFVDLMNVLYGITEFQLVPIIQADQFEAIDKPLVRSQDVEALRQKWKEWEGEINALGKRS